MKLFATSDKSILIRRCQMRRDRQPQSRAGKTAVITARAGLHRLPVTRQPSEKRGVASPRKMRAKRLQRWRLYRNQLELPGLADTCVTLPWAPGSWAMSCFVSWEQVSPRTRGQPLAVACRSYLAQVLCQRLQHQVPSWAVSSSVIFPHRPHGSRSDPDPELSHRRDQQELDSDLFSEHGP